MGGFNPKFIHAYPYELALNIFSKIINYKSPNKSLYGNKGKIHHISKILYHTRIWHRIKMNSKEFWGGQQLFDQNIHLLTEQYQAVRAYANRQKLAGATMNIDDKGIFRQFWRIPTPNPKCSIIIPTRDGYSILKKCIASVIAKTQYSNYEIIIIDNETTCRKTLDYFHLLRAQYPFIRILEYPHVFNYSDMMNFGVNKAKGSVICLLNNDTEVISSNWLNLMIGQACRPSIGCVGALLLYPDKSVQHAGVIIGMHGVADHAFKGLFKSNAYDPYGQLISIRNPKAVTAAALVVRKKLYISAGGFDAKKLKIAFNDVDFCLKLLKMGYFHIWLPDAELFHHESKSRGAPGKNKDDNPREKIALQKKWKVQDFSVRNQ